MSQRPFPDFGEVWPFYVGSSSTWFGRQQRDLVRECVRGYFESGWRLVRSSGGLRSGGLVVEEIGANAGQKVVAVEGWVRGEDFYQIEGGLRAVEHGDGHGSIKFDDRGWGQMG
jgi:hypothetical protein